MEFLILDLECHSREHSTSICKSLSNKFYVDNFEKLFYAILVFNFSSFIFKFYVFFQTEKIHTWKLWTLFNGLFVYCFSLHQLQFCAGFYFFFIICIYVPISLFTFIHLPSFNPFRLVPDITLTLKMGGSFHLPQCGHVLLRLCY